ncbi:hypothetical protein [Aliamphritea spongicola]|nr:hypothetical protein [Aliamphritea spongicola]
MIPVRKTILLGHVPEPDASRLLILEKPHRKPKYWHLSVNSFTERR